MSAKNTGIGGTLKGLRINDLEIAFQKNLSQKTRFWAIVVRKFSVLSVDKKWIVGVSLRRNVKSMSRVFSHS